jgi:hypothetical protein
MYRGEKDDNRAKKRAEKKEKYIKIQKNKIRTDEYGTRVRKKEKWM